MLEFIALALFGLVIIGAVIFARGLENRGKYSKAHMLDRSYGVEIRHNHTTSYKG